MRSANSCFSVPLFKKQVKRFWPMFSLYTLLLFMLMPVYFLMTQPNSARAQDYLIGMAAEGALWIGMLFGVFAAMAVWSYLYNHRALSMIHALPLTRGSLFLTNYLCGLSFALLPNLLIFVLTLGVQTLLGVVTLPALLMWLLCQSLFCLFFFSFATLIAFVTGHILVLPWFFAIFNWLTKVITTLIDGLFSTFVYGYTGGSLAALEWFGGWFAPSYALMTKVGTTRPEMINQVRQPLELSGLSVIVTFAIVGLLMTVVAYLFYRRRRLELSGEVVVVGFLQPVFKYGVAVCAGLCFGTLFFEIFQEVFSRGIGTLLACLLLWAAVGYYTAEMLLHKSFRVIRKSLKGLLVLLVLMTATILAMEWDLGGYERNTPQASEVSSVTFVGRGAESTDPEIIQGTIALHESLVQEKREIERREREQKATEQKQTYTSPYLRSMEWTYVRMEYQLVNGDTLKREYRIPVSQELLAREDSPAKRYLTLLNRPDWTLRSYFPDQLRAEDLLNVEIETTQPHGDRIDHNQSSFSGADAQLLLAAVREDLAAGRLGYDYILQTQEVLQTNYINSIYFNFRGDYNMQVAATGHWYLNDYSEKRSGVNYEVNLTLQGTASATLAALETLGLRPGENLLSQYDAMSIEDSGKYLYYKDYAYAESAQDQPVYPDAVLLP